MSVQPADDLIALAQAIREHSIRMISRAGSAHIGGAFSSSEILSVLYGAVLRHRPEESSWPERDRFVMSKGHCCAALYSVLALRGFFPLSRLDEFYTDGGTLPGHVTHKGIPGVEVSTGSLGHGLALGVGFATGATRRAESWRVFVLLSDGECDEGSTWEAALLASAWKLGNLTVIVDYNKIQSLGRVEEVVDLEPFADKWRAFGWNVSEVDGHQVEELRGALMPEPSGPAADRPLCVIAHTVKGKGVSFMEDDLLWHYRCPRDEEFDRAMAELRGSP